MARGIEFSFLADAKRMAAGLRSGRAALDELGDEARKTDLALRSIKSPDIRPTLDTTALAALRTRLKAQVEAIERDIVDISVDIDAGKAIRDLNRLEREIRKIDRMDAKVDIEVDKDGRLGGKLGSLAGGFSQLGGSLAGLSASGGPYTLAATAAGIAAVAAVAAGPVIGGVVALAGALGGFKVLEEFGKYEADARKFGVVFGDLAPVMDQWVESIPSELSNRQLKSLAAGVQDLLVPQGFSRAEAANITKSVVERGTALAKFSGRDTADGIEAVTAALLGEREQLQGLGVAISQSEVDQWVKDNAASVAGLSESQAQTAATLALIEQKSGDAWTAYQQGVGTAQGAVDSFKSSFANLKDTVIAEAGGIASEIIAAFDLSGMQNPFEQITSWIKENKATIKNLMIDVADAVLVGADAVLGFGKMVITAFTSAWPVISGFIDAITWAWQGLLLSMAASPLAKALGISDDLKDAAASAGELSDSIQKIGDDFVGMSGDAIAGIDGARGSLSDLRGQLKGMEDTKLRIGVALEREGVVAASAEINKLTEPELLEILSMIDPATASETDRKIYELAKERLLAVKPELQNTAAFQSAVAQATAARTMQVTPYIPASAMQLLRDYIGRESFTAMVKLTYTRPSGPQYPSSEPKTLLPVGASALPMRITISGREVSYIVEDALQRSRDAQALQDILGGVL